jgi:hypothetical protein
MGRRAFTTFSGGTFSALVFTAGCLALFGTACEEDPKRPPVLGDGPAQPGSSVGGGGGEGGVLPRGDAGDAGDGGSCTDLPNTGTEVPQNAVVDDVTPGSGGTIVEGTYNLTEARLLQGPSALPGPTGYSFQASIRITGQLYERVLVVKSSGGATSETRSTGTFVPNGTSATIVLSCPSSNQESVTYSAGSDSLTVSNLITKESFVFTRKP